MLMINNEYFSNYTYILKCIPRLVVLKGLLLGITDGMKLKRKKAYKFAKLNNFYKTL